MKKNKLKGAIDATVEGFRGAFKSSAYTAGGKKVFCPHTFDQCCQLGNLAITENLMNKVKLRNVTLKVFDKMHKD